MPFYEIAGVIIVAKLAYDAILFYTKYESSEAVTLLFMALVSALTVWLTHDSFHVGAFALALAIAETWRVAMILLSTAATRMLIVPGRIMTNR